MYCKGDETEESEIKQKTCKRENYHLPVEHIAELNSKGPVLHEDFSGPSRI
jgi:hypothetical protein